MMLKQDSYFFNVDTNEIRWKIPASVMFTKEARGRNEGIASS